MRVEIERLSDYCSDEEWNRWKRSLLSDLGIDIDSFSNPEIEKLLHDWWCLRIKYSSGIIDKEKFDEEKKVLFPDYEESDLEDPLSNPLLFHKQCVILLKTQPLQFPKKSKMGKDYFTLPR